ncbi:MAG: hypothetical protein ACXWLM_01120, partial [Myxococcales bacterium]
MSRIVLIAALAIFATATWKERRKELQAEAESQRKKLGLDDKKLYAQYPTPELTFDGEPVKLACGGTGTLHITARVPKGTAFLLNDDDVQIVDQKATADGWQAKVKVSPTAAPRDVSVHAIAPVSGAERDLRVATVGGKYALDLRFEDGWTAHFADGSLSWKKGSEARTTQAELDPQGGRIEVRWQRSQEELDAQQKMVEKLQGAGGQEEMQRAMKRVQDCMARPEPERVPCIQSVQKQNDADIAAMNKKVQQAQDEAEALRPTAAWACSDLRLEAAAGAL